MHKAGDKPVSVLMGMKAVPAVIVLALGFASDGCVEPAVKGFHQAMGPRCAWAGEPVFNVTGFAKPVHRMAAGGLNLNTAMTTVGPRHAVIGQEQPRLEREAG